MARGLAFMGGLALAVTGVALVSIPAALIVAGGGVMTVAWLDQRAELRQGRADQ